MASWQPVRHHTHTHNQSIHHTGIRFTTGAFRSSRVDSLLCNAGKLPWDLRLVELVM